jgi:sRNA-binding protein
MLTDAQSQIAVLAELFPQCFAADPKAQHRPLKAVPARTSPRSAY